MKAKIHIMLKDLREYYHMDQLYQGEETEVYH